MIVLKQSPYAIVCQAGQWVYKIASIEFTLNEYRWTSAMAKRGYAPVCLMLDAHTIRTRYLGNQAESWSSVTDPYEFLSHKPLLLGALKDAGVRHGDLTRYAVIVVDNKPYLIDFAQSRSIHSTLPDKRPQGDEFWLSKTMDEILEMSRKEKER